MSDKTEGQAGPGLVVLFGSGETAPSGRKAYDLVLSRAPQPPKIALLETPAGFELNSSRVIGRVGEFLEERLQNYTPEIQVVPARQRGTDFSPDDAQLVSPLLEADVVFMGPGSPSYAVRQLKDSRAWDYLVARQRLGGALVLASAAAIAISALALPVYEIYKVGEDLHWKEGLDFFAAYGLPVVFIPHWNNNDGGAELDTSRCFMGEERFARLVDLLPPDITVIGIDEKTALVMDIQAGECQVVGIGGVTLIHTGWSNREAGQGTDNASLAALARERNAHVHQYPHKARFPLSVLGAFTLPSPGAGLPEDAWQAAVSAVVGKSGAREAQAEEAPGEVLQLAERRQQARQAKDWQQADRLRAELASLGWLVQDTPEGPRLEPLK